MHPFVFEAFSNKMQIGKEVYEKRNRHSGKSEPPPIIECIQRRQEADQYPHSNYVDERRYGKDATPTIPSSVLLVEVGVI